MVYQEQVMRIAQVVGGYSLGGADLLRRAMGKKKPEEMAKQRAVFVEGAGRQGVRESVATQLFDLMEKFAGYGFNKSHSAAYALVAYQTAYFKVHFPAAFMAANMTAVMDDTDKVKELVEDCRHLGLTIEAPDVNRGVLRFEPVDAKTIRYGLGGIKGTGKGAIEAIVAARAAGGPFSGLADFCARVDRHVVNRRVVEALVRAGAFDGLRPHRSEVFASVGRALEAADTAAAHAGQVSLFGEPGQDAAAAFEYVAAAPWSERERLANEKLALGYYFSGHLFAEYAAEARRLAPTRLADVRQAKDQVRLAGVIVSARTQNTRRGRMGVVVLDDASAQLELMVFSELFDRKRALLKEDTLVFVLGRVRFDEFNQRLSVSADDVMDLAEARARAAAALHIDVDGSLDVGRLREALAPYRVGNGQAGNGCRIVVSYCNGAARAEIPLPEDWRVRPDDALLADLRAQTRVREAKFSYA
jgi:DNA polymerase-3 subunit alpha